MREIPLTKGKVALVDNEDYERIVAMGSWYYSNDGYAVRTDNKNRVRVLMHRIILNTPEGMQTDHKNHDGCNNQKSNLRICTNRENCQNRRPKGSSRYKGITWHPQGKKWRAQIRVNKKLAGLL